MDQPSTSDSFWVRARENAWTLALGTVRGARKDRVLGVSAEIAFFAMLSIPSIVLLLAGIATLLGPTAVSFIRDQILTGLGTFLAPDTLSSVVRPAVESLFARAQGGVLGVGAVLALWSGSRMMRVLIEAMNIAYDIEEWRPAWQRRLLAVGLTLGGVVALLSFFPVLVFGPRLGAIIAEQVGLREVFASVWHVLYWPVVSVLAIVLLALVYHVAPNWRTPWRRDLPGAVLAAATWLASAVGLRLYVDRGFDGGAFGPLAAPIVLLLWLYVTGIAVLLGAELNAEIERMWPSRLPHLKREPGEGRERMRALRAWATRARDDR